MFSRWLNDRGLSAIEVLVGVGLVAAAATGMMLYQEQVLSSSMQIDRYRELSEMRLKLYERINSPEGWAQIALEPKNKLVNCSADAVGTNGECPLQTVNPMKISNADGVLMVDSFNENYGFMSTLAPCTTFGLAEGNCKLRAEATWRALCSSNGQCTQAEIAVNFKAADGAKEVLNAPAFGFKLYKNITLGATLPPGTWTESFTVTNSLTREDPLFDVFLILDNSTSMEDNREKLATSLMSFVDSLKGFNVRYRVYTTESLIGLVNNSNLYQTHIHGKEAYMVGSGVYTYENGTTETGPYDIYKLRELTSPLTFEGKFNIEKDLGSKYGKTVIQKFDDADLTSIKADLNYSINLASGPGSNEAGLCTLSRLIWDNGGPNDPIDPKNRAIFLILSDENDSTAEALDGYNGWYYSCSDKVKLTRQGTPKITHCWSFETCGGARSVNLWTKTKPGKGVSWTFQKVDTFQYASKTLCSGINPGDCGTPGSYDCTAAEIQLGNDSYHPGAGYVQSKCVVNVSDGGMSWGKGRTFLDSKFTAGDPSKLCENQPFTYDGVAYAGIRDFYIKNGIFTDADIADPPVCTATTSKLVYDYAKEVSVMGSGLAPTYLSSANAPAFKTQSQSLYSKITDRLRQIYGPTGYSLVNVIHDANKDSDAGCALNATSGSYGVDYKNVLLTSDTPGNLHSICEDNYSAGLTNLQQMIKSVSLSTFALTKFNPTTDKIDSITITRAGVPVTFGAGDWTLTDVTIQFVTGLVQEGDVITVYMSKK